MLQSKCEFGRCTLDLAEHRLFRDGRPVALTPRVFELLRVLVENAGHLVEKERLFKEVWNDAVVEEANLNRAISVLRKALGETETDRYIETVPKRGYRFVAAVGPASSDSNVPASTSVGQSASIANTRTVRFAVLLLGLVAAVVAIYIRAKHNPADRTAGAAVTVHHQLTFTGKEITPALSPDGRRIAFVSKESPHRKLVVQDVAGGHQIEIFSAPEVGALRWAPDSSELTFWARGDGTSAQYIAPAAGGSARKLAAGLFVSSWSPDGGTIALALFVSGRIIFLNRLGEVQRNIPLQGTREWIWDLDWSRANGRLLIVVDDHQRRPAIWTIRPDGTTQTKAFTGTTEILAARWTPAGDAIYYFTRVNQTVSLYKLLLDASRQRASGDPLLLVSGLETDEGFGISADGKRLVFARAPYYANLWLVEAGGSRAVSRPVRQTQLTPGTAVSERPRVSPDGSTILFNMGYESRANLYTIPASGGTPKQLTFLNAFSVDGAWSADGRSVAFASTEGGKAGLWIVNADGSSPRPLQSGDMSESFDVSWAPGARILYQQTGNRNFYIVDPRNAKARLLIKDASVGWNASAEYSPDGKKIAVSWNRRPTRGVWLIDAEDSRETLVYGARRPSDPVPVPIGWSPDGKFILAYDGKRAAYRGITASFEETITDARIFRVPVKGGPPELLLTLPFDEVGSIAMFPDGRRFVASVYSSRSDVWAVDNFDVTPLGTSAGSRGTSGR
jgi:Tol biopolymer transport system component/DNA-binding winged helix-turn-helix (wHTH) protein